MLLAVASGVAMGATFSPHGGALLPFLAFAPLGAALVAGGGTPFALGFAAATVGHGIGLYWMVPALAWRTALAVPAHLLVVCLIGMLAGAACEGAALLRRRWRWPLPVALATCWTGWEWVAAQIPGFSYAWLNAGMSLAWSPALAAGSELFGARFLTVWTVAVGTWTGVAGANWWVGRGQSGTRTAPRWRPHRTLPALALAILPAVAGHIRQATLPEGHAVARVAAVQPGRGGGELDDWLGPVRAAGAVESLDFVAFPERFLAAPPRAPGREPPAAREATGTGVALATFAESVDAMVLVGAMDADVVAAATDTLWYNAAHLQAPGGDLSPAYRKTRLVPGLEGMGWWPRALPAFGARGYAPGRETRPLVSGTARVGVMICYDSAFGETARILARDGAQWLAVLSNDDWLDPGGEFRVTWAYWQHATHARLRAVENRISVLQVGATGHTFAVPPGGTAAPAALEPGTAGVAVLEASRRSGVTLFTLTGDLVGPACLLVLVVGLVAGRSRGTGLCSRLMVSLPTPSGRTVRRPSSGRAPPPSRSTSPGPNP